MRTFFSRKHLKVQVSEHALTKISDGPLRDRVLAVLDVISDEPEFFFRNAKKDPKVSIPDNYRGNVGFVMGFKDLRFVFFLEPASNLLTLITVFENLKVRQ